jgi:hypothetical protein
MCVYWRLGLPGEGGGRSRGSPSREQLRPRAHRCRPQLRGATFPFPETFRIAVISDPDKKSKAKDKAEWRAQYMTGTLRRNGETYAVSWDEPASVGTGMNEAGRGAELSELVRYNGGLYTFDDRTGIMFEILNPEDRCGSGYRANRGGQDGRLVQLRDGAPALAPAGRRRRCSASSHCAPVWPCGPLTHPPCVDRWPLSPRAAVRSRRTGRRRCSCRGTSLRRVRVAAVRRGALMASVPGPNPQRSPRPSRPAHREPSRPTTRCLPHTSIPPQATATTARA